MNDHACSFGAILGDSARDDADLIPDDGTWVRDAAEAVDPETRSVATSTSGTLTYDVFVVAPGVAAIRKQAPVVVENLLAFRAGRSLAARMTGTRHVP